jgi:ribosomal protein L37E
VTIRGCERCGNPTPSGRHRYCEECGFARYVERQRRTDRWASLETLRVAYARRKATKTSREYGTRHQKLRAGDAASSSARAKRGTSVTTTPTAAATAAPSTPGKTAKRVGAKATPAKQPVAGNRELRSPVPVTRASGRRPRLGLVAEAVTRDLRAIYEVAPELGSSGLAALALSLAREMDNPGNSATSKSMCARALQEALKELRSLVPEKPEGDALDDIVARRAERRSGVAVPKA